MIEEGMGGEGRVSDVVCFFANYFFENFTVRGDDVEKFFDKE